MAHVFKEGKMLSNVADSYLANGIAAVDVIDGALVTLGDLVADTTYTNTGVEYDTYEAAAPEAATDEVVIVDYAGIETYAESGYANNNVIKEGIKLYGLTVKAGDIFRVRRLALHDKFWLGEGNFVAAPVVGEYATATAGDQKHTAAATLPQSGYAIKVLVQRDLTVGMSSKGYMYLCEVVQL